MPSRKHPSEEVSIPETTKSMPPSRTRRYLSKAWKWLLGLASALVALSGLLAYMPLLTVDVASPLDPNDAFSYPYIVSNDSILPLLSVNILCTFTGGEFADGGTFSGNTYEAQAVRFMAPHQKATAPCHRGFKVVGAPLKKGTVTVTISYYSFIWPHRTHISRSFQAALTSENKTIWLPE